MTPIEVLAWIGLALLGFVGSSICSGVETGCYCLSRVRLDVRAARVPPDRSARLLRAELENPRRLLATLLISNNIFNYANALGFSALLGLLDLPDSAQVLINVAVVTPLLFVIGEALPKEAFRVGADRLVYPFAPVLVVFRGILTGVLLLPALQMLAEACASLLRVQPEAAVTSGSRAYVATLMREGESQGLLSESQTRLVDRALEFRRARVGDEMVAWAGVRTIVEDSSRDQVLRVIGRERFSRFPVVDRRGHVVGVMEGLDAYIRPGASLAELMRPPVRLSPEEPVRAALVALRRSEARLAIVERDGRPVGIVTFKDLVEPLTGELAEW